jgi:hypothetical protein
MDVVVVQAVGIWHSRTISSADRSAPLAGRSGWSRPAGGCSGSRCAHKRPRLAVTGLGEPCSPASGIVARDSPQVAMHGALDESSTSLLHPILKPRCTVKFDGRFSAENRWRRINCDPIGFSVGASLPNCWNSTLNQNSKCNVWMRMSLVKSD